MVIDAVVVVVGLLWQQSAITSVVSDIAEEVVIEGHVPPDLAAHSEKLLSRRVGRLRFVSVAGCGRTGRILDAESYREWRTSVHPDSCVLAEVIKIGQYRLTRIAGQRRSEWRTLPEKGRIADLLRSVVFPDLLVPNGRSGAMVTLYLHITSSDLLEAADSAYREFARELGPECHLRLVVRPDDCFGADSEYPTANVFADHASCPAHERELSASVACLSRRTGPACRYR